MTARKSLTRWKLSEEEIDTIVETQAADNSAWEKPIHVRKRKSAAVSITDVPVETNTRPICDGREGRRSVEVVQAIYESSRTGRPVIIAGRANKT